MYNLSLPQRLPRRSPQLGDNTRQRLADCLQHWAARTEPSDKLAVLLDHQYTPAQFSLRHLKTKDFTTAQLLYDAAQASDCELHLALLSYHENGEPELDYDPTIAVATAGGATVTGTMTMTMTMTMASIKTPR